MFEGLVPPCLEPIFGFKEGEAIPQPGADIFST